MLARRIIWLDTASQSGLDAVFRSKLCIGANLALEVGGVVPARFEVAVVGGGPVGLATALALGRLGLAAALITEPLPSRCATPGDARTSALFAGSIELLRNLGVWEDARRASEPIGAIRLVDDTGSLLRAPEVLFEARELGLEAFGWNVPNAALVAALSAGLDSPASNVVRLGAAGLEMLDIGRDEATLTLRDGSSLAASLVAAADGRRSVCRAATGIAVKSWDYPQSALAASFTHARPHGGISTEFHGRHGPCTTVPLPGKASSLVWVEAPETVARLGALDEAAFRSALEGKLMGLLGAIGDIGPRAAFPLSRLSATTFARNRVALIGEAAHVIPPIGAQGLNLGLRDAAALADCAAGAVRHGRDPGGREILEAYAAARRPDVALRLATVDLLNRSLLSEFLPVHLVRGLGLHALRAIGPLRRLLVREGLGPSSALPSLMQPAEPRSA